MKEGPDRAWAGCPTYKGSEEEVKEGTQEELSSAGGAEGATPAQNQAP